MKLTPLLISILVFFTSGVMCLFTTADVSAQVPQTKRSEIDGWLKGIRSKKKNNDLQNKAKYKSSKSGGIQIRFRILAMDTIKFQEGKAWTVSKYIHLGKWGIGQSEFGYKNDYNHDKFRLNVKYSELAYFNKNLNFAIGAGKVSSGLIKVSTSIGEIIKSENIEGSSAFLITGINLNFIELLFGVRMIELKSDDFDYINMLKHPEGENTSSFNETKYKIKGFQTQIGLGIIF